MAVPTLASAPAALAEDVPAGIPAGCLSVDDQAALATPQAMLDYADRLLSLSKPLSQRLLSKSWNAYTNRYYGPQEGIFSILVDDVQNEYMIQAMLDALHVAGFVGWLRGTAQGQQMHILALPLLDPQLVQPSSPWEPYLRAYWQDRFAVPTGDAAVLPALKLPPCGWMVERGFAPALGSGWWTVITPTWPDYAWAGEAYLASNTQEANRVSQQIDWLGPGQLEGPTSMCGPLSWSIMNDAGAFPPGIGAWSWGAKAFWLAKPTENGRPWSLFPPTTYTVHRFETPLSRFDFSAFPLYPGDFLYTYSKKDGFDHMLVVTEVDAEGNAFAVTNLIQVYPERKATIERVLLYNASDPSTGIMRNEWARDGRNGRTGHDGFDVFRWSWMEKDISGQPVPYEVQPGDTLGLVAERWRTPARAIAEYNGIALDAGLVVGQVIYIPPNANPGLPVISRVR